MRKNKIDDALLDCYIELYKHADPPADFQHLMDTAELNDRGQKVIDFMAYELDHETFDRILEESIKKHKIKGYKAQMFRNTIWMGCSPKYKNKLP
jgi:hypothetical protein